MIMRLELTVAGGIVAAIIVAVVWLPAQVDESRMRIDMLEQSDIIGHQVRVGCEGPGDYATVQWDWVSDPPHPNVYYVYPLRGDMIGLEDGEVQVSEFAVLYFIPVEYGESAESAESSIILSWDIFWQCDVTENFGGMKIYSADP